jgi:ABC-type Fe3+ transport system permease subunit
VLPITIYNEFTNYANFALAASLSMALGLLTWGVLWLGRRLGARAGVGRQIGRRRLKESPSMRSSAHTPPPLLLALTALVALFMLARWCCRCWPGWWSTTAPA